jgi:hypothetical protein
MHPYPGTRLSIQGVSSLLPVLPHDHAFIGVPASRVGACLVPIGMARSAYLKLTLTNNTAFPRPFGFV